MRPFRQISRYVRPVLNGGGTSYNLQPNTSNAATAAAAAGAFTFAATAAGVAAISMCSPRVVEAGAPPMQQSESTSEFPSSHKSLTNPLLGRYVVADAVDRILPSVVKIRMTILGERRRSLFSITDGSPVELGLSYGSGFVIHSDSNGTEILTNAHVVHDAGLKNSDVQAEICVTAATGESFPASIVAFDEASDLAIIRVDDTNDALPPATLANSDSVRAGEFVVAVGAPLTLGNSCSFGVISCLRRDLERTTGEDATGLPLLQTDLAINHGSSGGPLCDLDGRVLGICSKKVEGGVEGIAFAIPMNTAVSVIQELRNHGKVRKPFLGLAVISLTAGVVDDIRNDPNYLMPKWLEKEIQQSKVTPFSRGLIVHDVIRKGPADIGGIRKGDVILSVDGVGTETASEFLGEMNFKVGRKVTLKLRRFDSGVVNTVVVTPETMENDS